MSSLPEDCDRLETPPDVLGAPVVRDAGGAITDIYATPRGDDRYVNGQTRATLPLAEALALAPAGATVHLLPGMYHRAVALYRRRGRDGAPIRIRGTRAPDGTLLSRLCGTNAAGSIYPKLPDGDDYAFFRLTGCRYIEIADVAVQDCWPCFVYAESCTGITLNRVEVQAGTYVLFARGRGSRGFRVLDSHWVQDPTGALWSEIPFVESHHGRYAYYNGALFGSVDIAGDVRIAGNHVRNAFNGVRLTADRDASPPVRAVNVDVVIRDNTFENIRDNAVEPEVTALNWHVCHNRIKNCHAAFSLEAVRGGFWYLYGNLIWFDGRPGQPFQDNRGGKVNKLDDRAFVRGFPPGADEAWPSSVVFDYDLSSRPFGALRSRHGQEAHGLGETDPGFRDPARGDVRLHDHSPARGAGTAIRLRARHDWSGAEDWCSQPGPGRPNIGAWQDSDLTEGPPLQPLLPEG